MVKVIVPNPQYRGVIGEVQFDNGVGHFKDRKVAERIAKQFGFEIQEDQPDSKPVEEEKKPAPKRKRKAGE